MKIRCKLLYLWFDFYAVVTVRHAKDDKPIWNLLRFWIFKDSVDSHDRSLGVDNLVEKKFCCQIDWEIRLECDSIFTDHSAFDSFGLLSDLIANFIIELLVTRNQLIESYDGY